MRGKSGTKDVVGFEHVIPPPAPAGPSAGAGDLDETKLDTLKRRRPRWVRALLRAYADCGRHYESADRARIGYQAVLTWRQEHPDNQAAVDVALDRYAERLEREADRRAIDGLLRKKFQRNGDPIIDPATGEQYEEREYSDTLLIVRLKAVKPAVYRDHIDLTSGGDKLQPIRVINEIHEARPDEPGTDPA